MLQQHNSGTKFMATLRQPQFAVGSVLGLPNSGATMTDHGGRGWEATDTGWRCTECHHEVAVVDVHVDDAHRCAAPADPRDAVIAVLAEHEWRFDYLPHERMVCTCGKKWGNLANLDPEWHHRAHVADQLMPLLAQAWDDGYLAGDADQYVGVMPSKRTVNPYRTETADPETLQAEHHAACDPADHEEKDHAEVQEW